MGKKALARQKKRERAAAEAAAAALAGIPEPTLDTTPAPSAPRNHADADPPAIDPSQAATHLNSVAIHLLRRLRREDAALGVCGARLSALSVLVFGGARTIGKLAEAEGVTPPSMTRLITAMEAEGLVRRAPSPTDGRSVIITATPEGERIMLRGREQRVAALAGWLSPLHAADLATVEVAADLLDGILGTQTSGRRRHS
jgi:DNA-binding MarR family transcriptional regulator